MVSSHNVESQCLEFLDRAILRTMTSDCVQTLKTIQAQGLLHAIESLINVQRVFFFASDNTVARLIPNEVSEQLKA